MPDGTYVIRHRSPSAGTRLPSTCTSPRSAGRILQHGLGEGPDGRPLVGYLDREAGVSGTADIVTAPIDEAAYGFPHRIGSALRRGSQPC